MMDPVRLACVALGLALATGASGGAALVAQAPQAPSQPPSASQDVFAFVRALDEAAARGVWPGFSPTGIPVALYDGEHTILLRHPSPPPEFSPMPGRPGVLIANGRHPGVTGNSTREIGGVRTATVIATPAQPVERTMLAVVEEVFHVFWLARHPSFRPNEMARYAYPLDDVENLGRLVAENEALARALEAQRIDDAAGWAAVALADPPGTRPETGRRRSRLRDVAGNDGRHRQLRGQGFGGRAGVPDGGAPARHRGPRRTCVGGSMTRARRCACCWIG